MRTLRCIAVGMVLGATLTLPLQAQADGGAFIDFGRTYAVQGTSATGRAFVAVPENHQDVFERGPFFGYLVPSGTSFSEGEPLPHGVIRLGAFSIAESGRDAFELRIKFDVPPVQSGMYTVRLCNDPCTISGFREPLSGLLTIARTPAEAKLIREVDGLTWQVRWLRSRVDKLKDANEELQAALDDVVAERNELSAIASDARTGPANPIPSVVPAAGEDRPLVDAWALVAIAIALIVGVGSVALGLVFSRRHGPRIVVPDTIAELGEEAGELVRH